MFKKLIISFLRFLFNYKFTILCALFFYTICIKFNKWNFAIPYYTGAFSVVSLLLIILLLSKIKYSFLFTFLLGFLVALDSYFAFTFDHAMAFGSMASIIETNSLEAQGALKTAIRPALFFLFLSLCFIFMAQVELKKSSISLKKATISLAIFILVLFPLFCTAIIKINERYKADIKTNPILAIQQITLDYFPLVYNDIFCWVGYKYEMHKFKKFSTTKRTLPEGIKLKNKEMYPCPDKIYFIIGESSWRKHYSLYGYPITTTPFLDSMKQSPDFAYYTAISPAPITREALKLVLSFSTPFTSEPIINNKNLVELAKEAGYEVVWCSNQDKMGMYEGYTGFISSKSDIIHYPSSDKREDFDVLTYVKKNYKPNKKQFFILHLMGSHHPYNMYDKIDETAIPGNKDTQKYDRTVHHTDRLLHKVYEIMEEHKDNSSLMVYFSDHGEKIGLGHGFMEKGASQFEIPYLTINKSMIPIDTIISQYIDKKTTLLNSVNTIYIMAQILGYHIPEKYINTAIKETKYVFHTDFNVYSFSKIQEEDKN